MAIHRKSSLKTRSSPLKKGGCGRDLPYRKSLPAFLFQREGFYQKRRNVFLCGIASFSLTALSSPFCVSVSCADYHAEVVQSSGTIEGTIFFPGETPPRAMFGNNAPGCP